MLKDYVFVSKQNPIGMQSCVNNANSLAQPIATHVTKCEVNITSDVMSLQLCSLDLIILNQNVTLVAWPEAKTWIGDVES